MKMMKAFLTLLVCGVILSACASTPAENHDAERARANAGYDALNSETENQ